MQNEFILTHIENGVCTVKLNRPDVLNSFHRDMALELQSVLDHCAETAAIRAIYLTGEGRAFCAGQDLAEAIAEDGPELQSIVRDHYNPIIRKIRSIEKPVVCGVNGVAAGAGANIALACDMVVATASSSFIQAFSKIGLIPDSGGTFFLPRLIGLQRATALMMLGEKVPADKALEFGMIYRVVEDDAIATEGPALAAKLARMPTKGLGYTKRALNASLSNNLDDQLDVEEQLQTAASQTHDYSEGVNAFLEKRKPEFKGE